MKLSRQSPVSSLSLLFLCLLTACSNGTTTPTATLAAESAGTPIPASLPTMESLPGPTFFVAGESGTLTAIGLDSGQLLGQIHLGPDSGGLALAPDGGTLYFLAPGSGELVRVNLLDGSEGGRLQVGKGASGLAILPDGGTAFVAEGPEGGEIAVIDLLAFVVTMRISVGRVGGLRAGAVSSDGDQVFFSDASLPGVVVIDPRTDSIIKEIPTGAGPGAIVPVPGLKQMLVNLTGTNQTLLVDTRKLEVVLTYDVGQSPQGTCVTPNGARAFVANAESGDLTVIDMGAGRVLRSIPLGARPRDCVVTADGRFVYVAVAGENALVALDTLSLEILNRIPAGEGPQNLLLVSPLS